MRHNAQFNKHSSTRPGQHQKTQCNRCGHVFQVKWETIHIGASNSDDCDEFETIPFPDYCPSCGENPWSNPSYEVAEYDLRELKYEKRIWERHAEIMYGRKQEK